MTRLNDNYLDTVTGEHHCPGCGYPVCHAHGTHLDHLAAEWRHFVWTYYPPILALDERGMTIENKIATPGRTVLAVLPIATSIRYCLDCHPFVYDEGCGVCGKDVDLTDSHTEVSTLVVMANGMNLDYRNRVLHIDCLPAEFASVIQIRNQRKADIP